MTAPNLFLVGAPKTATTALAAHLGQHPNICFHPSKETQVFATDLINGEKAERYKAAPDRVFSHFAGRKERYYGDGSTWHLFSRVAARKIAAHNPDARVIISVRNPVDLVSSLYHFRIATGQWPQRDFEYFWEKEAAALSESRIRTRGVVTEVARFTPQIERYFRAFGRENVKVVFYDDMRRDERAVIASLFDFLGLDPCDISLGKHNVTKPRRSLAFQKLIAWRPPLVTPMLYALPKPLRRGAYNTLTALNTTSNPARRTLSTQLRARLAEHFLEDVCELESLLGRSLASWKPQAVLQSA